MDKSTVQALKGLIPTLNGSLPTELTELATSLLVQSRSKARFLKADEEIARSYACSHLACERSEAQCPRSKYYDLTNATLKAQTIHRVT